MGRTKLLTQLIDGFQDVQRAVLRHKESQTEGLPFGQKAVLAIVAARQQTNIKEISNVLQITSGAATQHVEALVQESLVTRKTDETDRRGVVVALTDEGQKVFTDMQQKRMEKVRAYFAEISDEDLETFVNVIHKVKERIHQ